MPRGQRGLRVQQSARHSASRNSPTCPNLAWSDTGVSHAVAATSAPQASGAQRPARRMRSRNEYQTTITSATYISAIHTPWAARHDIRVNGTASTAANGG
jgi:hypothetical protein